MNNPFATQTGSLILKAFEGSEHTWRTIDGIARSTGLPFGEVEEFVNTYKDAFEISPIKPGGIPLYTVKYPV